MPRSLGGNSLDQSFLLEQFELRPCARDITLAQPRRVNKVEVEVVDPELWNPSAADQPDKRCTHLFQALEATLPDGLVIYPGPLGRDPQLLALQPGIPNALTRFDLIPVDLQSHPSAKNVILEKS